MTISTLTFSVESEMSGDLFTCEAINDHFNSVQTVETKMFVERKPRLRIDVTDDIMYEGDKVMFRCVTDENDSLFDYSWSVGGRFIEEASGSATLVLLVTRQMHHSVITCAARDTTDMPLVKAFYKLDINCK